MIAGLRGTVESRGADHVVVDVGGVGYKVFAPATTVARLQPGESVRLSTHLYVREDQLTLYGFTSADELAFFELLIGVSGIGPRAALSLLATAPPGQLAAAIAGENVDFLTRVPGIGKKMAARLVLELQGKLGGLAGKAGLTAIGPGNAEVLAALTALGYRPDEVSQAIAALPPPDDLPVEERIRLALQALAR